VEVVAHILAQLDAKDLVLRAMASSNLWRAAALECTTSLSISSGCAPNCRLIAVASHAGSWPSLVTLRLHDGCPIEFDSAAGRKHRGESRRNVEAAFCLNCGFSNVVSFVCNLPSDVMRRSTLARMLRELPHLTAFSSDDAWRDVFVDTIEILAARPSLRERLQKLELGGISPTTTFAREEEAMQELGRLSNLDTLVMYPSVACRLPSMRSLRRLHVSDNVELGTEDNVSDEFIASVLATLLPLETLSLGPCASITGASLRSPTLTALSLCNCCDLTSDGLRAMVGGLPALRKLAFTCDSPTFTLDIFEEITTELEDLIAVIASCRELTEVRHARGARTASRAAALPAVGVAVRLAEWASDWGNRVRLAHSCIWTRCPLNTMMTMASPSCSCTRTRSHTYSRSRRAARISSSSSSCAIRQT
jgi:hypothetical protein